MHVDRYLMGEARKDLQHFREIVSLYRQAAQDTYLETPDAIPCAVKHKLMSEDFLKRCTLDSSGLELTIRGGLLDARRAIAWVLGVPYEYQILKNADKCRRKVSLR